MSERTVVVEWTENNIFKTQRELRVIGKEIQDAPELPPKVRDELRKGGYTFPKAD